jgi:DNA-binding transcriptional MerR regulator
MITENQKEAICNTLGKQYSAKIIAHLEKKKIKSLKNKDFTPKIIQDIVNGRSENTTVELQIVTLVNRVKKETEKAENKLKTLLHD